MKAEKREEGGGRRRAKDWSEYMNDEVEKRR